MFRNEQMVDIIARSPRVDDSICAYVRVDQDCDRNEKMSGNSIFCCFDEFANISLVNRWAIPGDIV